MFVIEKAKHKDIDEILEVQSKTFIDKGDWTNASSIDLSIDENLSYIAKDNNKIVGYLVAVFDDDTDEVETDGIFIQNVGVLSEYRGKGIGSKLMETILVANIKNSFTLLVDIDNSVAQELYKKLGFKIDKPKYVMKLER